jgi:hypothetical protein
VYNSLACKSTKFSINKTIEPNKYLNISRTKLP